jgi:hypothetical protein
MECWGDGVLERWSDVWLNIKVGNFFPRAVRFQVVGKVGNFWFSPILTGH